MIQTCMNGEAFVQPPDSYWEYTRIPRRALPALRGEQQTEVAIIGGGLTGLSAAHHLALADIPSVVIEAAYSGWGCSGRNGGFVVARYKRGFSALAHRLGHDVTRGLYALLLEGIDTVEQLIRDYEINCAFRRNGHLTAAHSPKGLALLTADREWLRREARDSTPLILDRAETEASIGTDLYLGGYLDPRSATVHPLNFTSGLASVLHRKGVMIFFASPARRVEVSGGGVVVHTEGGLVRARVLLVATDGYTNLAPPVADLTRRVVMVGSSLVVTEPVPPDVAARVVPKGWAVGDTRFLLNSFRVLSGNRVLFGGRGDITGKLGTPKVFRYLEENLVRAFPILRPYGISHRWSGMVAATMDDFPHLGREGNVFYALGYGGRGMVLSVMLGKYAAEMIRGRPVALGPITSSPFARIPLHTFRVPMLKAIVGYYRARDALKI